MRPIDLVHVGIIKPIEAAAECERNRYYLIGESLDETEDAYKAQPILLSIITDSAEFVNRLH